MTTINATIIDPCARSDFAEIAATHGIDAAFRARINALKAQVEQAKGMRWHCVRPERDLFNARFDYAWHLSGGNPARCRDILADATV